MLTQLPVEIQLATLSYLPIKELIEVSKTCSRIYRVLFHERSPLLKRLRKRYICNVKLSECLVPKTENIHKRTPLPKFMLEFNIYNYAEWSERDMSCPFRGHTLYVDVACCEEDDLHNGVVNNLQWPSQVQIDDQIGKFINKLRLELTSDDITDLLYPACTIRLSHPSDSIGQTLAIISRLGETILINNFTMERLTLSTFNEINEWLSSHAAAFCNKAILDTNKEDLHKYLYPVCEVRNELWEKIFENGRIVQEGYNIKNKTSKEYISSSRFMLTKHAERHMERYDQRYAERHARRQTQRLMERTVFKLPIFVSSNMTLVTYEHLVQPSSTDPEATFINFIVQALKVMYANSHPKRRVKFSFEIKEFIPMHVFCSKLSPLSTWTSSDDRNAVIQTVCGTQVITIYESQTAGYYLYKLRSL